MGTLLEQSRRIIRPDADPFAEMQFPNLRVQRYAAHAATMHMKDKPQTQLLIRWLDDPGRCWNDQG